MRTLELIDPFECNWKWQQFVFETNLVNVLVQMFKVDMCQACLVWKQHSSAIVPFIDPPVAVEQLLRAIPTDTLPFDVVLWLRHFVPIVAQIHPAVVGQMTEWCIEKTRALQYAQGWPQVGLEFITNIVGIFNGIPSVLSYLSENERHTETNVKKMNTVMHVLQDLSVLKTTYNLSLTLDDYMHVSRAFNFIEIKMITLLPPCIAPN